MKFNTNIFSLLILINLIIVNLLITKNLKKKIRFIAHQEPIASRNYDKNSPPATSGVENRMTNFVLVTKPFTPFKKIFSAKVNPLVTVSPES